VGNVTQYPAGLLDLLKVRDRGQMPSDLGNAVAGVVDFTQFYLLNQREVRTDTQPGPTAGGFNIISNAGQLQVPNGELWYVHSYFIAATLVPGQTINAAPAVRLPGNVNQQLGDYLQFTGLSSSLWSVWCRDPFWASPGADFGMLVANIAVGAGMTVVATAQVSRLRA
jgi:hypothetical protein